MTISFREKKIFLIYKYYLQKPSLDEMEKSIIYDEIYNFSKQEIKWIKLILSSIQQIEDILKKNLTSPWNWNEVTPIEKSILFNGCYELTFLTLSKKIIINEYTILAKKYGSNDQSYKFINGVLDN